MARLQNGFIASGRGEDLPCVAAHAPSSARCCDQPSSHPIHPRAWSLMMRRTQSMVVDVSRLTQPRRAASASEEVSTPTRRTDTRPKSFKTWTMDTKWDMTRFAEFDKDGDGKLKLEEFYALLTTGDQAKGDASIRKKVTLDRFWPLFNSYDLDQDGFIGLHDFWRWSLGNAVQKYGVDRLLATIRQYDQDKTRLDARKFERWCDDQGFGACARELFQDLNGDGSGTVDCAKLIQTLSESKISDEQLGPMHAALVKAYDSHARASLVEEIDTSKWFAPFRLNELEKHRLKLRLAISDLQAQPETRQTRNEIAKLERQDGELERMVLAEQLRVDDVGSIIEELRANLSQSGAFIIDLIHLFDKDAGMKLHVGLPEFLDAMVNRLGCKAPKLTLVEVFQRLDIGRNGVLSFDDIFEFVRGRRHSLDNRRRVLSMKLEPLPQSHPNRLGSKFQPTLDQLDWDPETFRSLVRQMLQRNRLGKISMIRAWDRARAGSDFRTLALNRSEFCSEMQMLFKDEHPDLWENEVEQVVERTHQLVLREQLVAYVSERAQRATFGDAQKAQFELASTRPPPSDDTIGVIHLERWLENPPKRDELPLKTSAQMLLQERRRREASLVRQATLQKSFIAPMPTLAEQEARVDECLATAAAKARYIADARKIAVQQSWTSSNLCHSSVRRHDVWQGVIPMPVLHRWEAPGATLEAPSMYKRMVHHKMTAIMSYSAPAPLSRPATSSGVLVRLKDRPMLASRLTSSKISTGASSTGASSAHHQGYQGRSASATSLDTSLALPRRHYLGGSAERYFELKGSA